MIHHLLETLNFKESTRSDLYLSVLIKKGASVQYRVQRSSLRLANNRRRNLGVFESIIKKYAQATPADPNAQTLDPMSVQMGQSIYDTTGQEYIIVEDDPTTTYKTLMPADQQGQQVPEGVMTVDDSELSVDYSVQQPAGTSTPKVV